LEEVEKVVLDVKIRGIKLWELKEKTDPKFTKEEFPKEK
jgi:hypothetical protein